jgi:hypothetical protein
MYSTSSDQSPRIEIPFDLIMSSRLAMNSSTLILPTSDIVEQIVEHVDRDTLILTLFLLDERDKDRQSRWYPYIRLLPETFSTPLFHKDNYLEYTSAFYLTQTMRQSMSDVYDLVGSTKFSLENFLWAYTVVVSRAFTLNDWGTTLIPLADLANHVTLSNEANLCSAGIDQTTDRFILNTTNKSIVNGDELSIKYNDLANWQLLLYYGFAIENNPFDSILVELQIDADDTYDMEMKKMLLFSLSKNRNVKHVVCFIVEHNVTRQYV